MVNNLLGVELRPRVLGEVVSKASENFLLKAELKAVGLVHTALHNSETIDCKKLPSRAERNGSLKATNARYDSTFSLR